MDSPRCTHSHGLAPAWLLALLPLAAGEAGPHDYVACWSLDEGAGLIAHDASPHGFVGELRNARWSPGMSGTALEFDSAARVELTDGDGVPDLIGGLAQGTLSLWFRFDSPPPAQEIHPLFYLGDGVGGAANSSLIVEIGHYDGDSKLYFTILTASSIPQCFDSGFDLAAGRWYHFAAVVGPGFNTGYLDGVEMTGRDYNFGGPTDDYFFADVPVQAVCWLGFGFLGHLGNEQFLRGAIDEVRLYDRPLGAQEILDYHEAVRASATSFCDSTDGALAACPCANPGDPDAGCDIAQGTGGVRLAVVAQATAPQNRATVRGTGYPPAGAPAAVVIRGTQIDPAAPVVFGDGLRCVSLPAVRLGAATAQEGSSTHALGHGAQAGGGTFFYQLWFRNQPAMFCTGDAFNLSNGATLTW